MHNGSYPILLLVAPNIPTTFSHLNPQSPILTNPRRQQKPTPNHHRAPREQLRILIPPTLLLDQLTRNRRACQDRERNNREHHPHARPLHAQIRRQGGKSGGEERLDGRGDDPVDDGPDVQAGGGGDRDPGVGEHGGDERDGDDGVEGAEEAVSEVVGNDAAGDADAVEDDEEIDGGGVGDVDYGAGEGAEVVEGEVHAPEILHWWSVDGLLRMGLDVAVVWGGSDGGKEGEGGNETYKEHPASKQHIRRLFKALPID